MPQEPHDHRRRQGGRLPGSFSAAKISPSDRTQMPKGFQKPLAMRRSLEPSGRQRKMPPSPEPVNVEPSRPVSVHSFHMFSPSAKIRSPFGCHASPPWPLCG